MGELTISHATAKDLQHEMIDPALLDLLRKEPR